MIDKPTSRIALSVAIITLDEEERLPQCLDSVAFADDIVVVDAGSRDRTVAIAKEHGARVFNRPWQGFGPQKKFAIEQCRNPWILILDADERIPLETAIELRAAMAGNPDEIKAYRLPRKNYFCGQWIKRAGWWPDPVVRLFRKESGRMSEQLVHEALAVNGTIGVMQNPIIHFTSRGLAQTMDKVNHYSSAGALELFRQGRHASLAGAALRGGWTFIHNYFIRFGFLDGGPGFLIAVTDAVNKFLKFAKLWDLNRRKTVDD